MRPSESIVNIALRAVTIAALGVVIGLADSAIRGPVMTKLAAPPPLPTGNGGGALPAPAPAPGDSTPAQPAPSGPGAPGATQPGVPTPPAPAAAVASLPEGHITIAQARALFDQQGQFVDSRKKEEYEAGHVQGAIRMELADFKDAIPAAVEFMVRDKEVIVYCIGGQCDESEAVGKQLNLLGFTKVYVMHDGFPAWRDAGHPVETGPGQW